MVITLARESRMDAINKFIYRRVYFNFNKSSTYSQLQLKSDRVFTATSTFFWPYPSTKSSPSAIPEVADSRYPVWYVSKRGGDSLAQI